MKFRIKFVCIFILLALKAQSQFGNEWIKDSRELYKVTIKEKGVYRILYEDLRKIGFPIESAVLSDLKMYHYGREVPISIIGEEDGSLDKQDYIEFYAEGNNGEQDSLLYRPNSVRMNPYHSLYSDETYYYLTFEKGAKRTVSYNNTNFDERLSEAYHLEQQVRAFNEQYSFNNSIGYPPFVMQSYYEMGEGWSSKIIIADSLSRFPIKLENYLPQQNLAPTLECLFNGRTEIVHDVKIFLQNNQNQPRIIGQIDYFGFSPLKIVTEIQPNEITADGFVQLRSQSSKKENVEWHSITYHKITYPQSFDMLNKSSKYFYLMPKNTPERHVSLTNAPPAAVVYQLKDRYNYRRVLTSTHSPKLTFVIDNTFPTKAILVSNEIKKPIFIEKIVPNNTYAKAANYLIITHNSLLQSSNEFAVYRASDKGGSFKTNVVDIQDLYLHFSYGERTPLAIRRFVEYQLAKGQKIDNLLLIGRSRSFPDALKSDFVSDLVPTMGYPGSDILLTAGLNNYDIDVQAVPTGRLNVVTNQEVINYLQKVKDYESNSTDLLWKKNILHLNGGLSVSEVNYFKELLKSFKPKVQNSFMAGKVESFSKKTTNNVENIDISEQLNKGVGMVTFIGHASATTTDLNIGFASSFNNNLQNKGKYPLMFFNGCGVGNVFNKYDLLTTDWLLTPDKGAIVILANSFWSYDYPTNRYLNNLYEKLFEDSETTGEPIGKIQQMVNAKIKSEGADLFMLSNIHQLILQGDPAIRIFPLKKPDYQLNKVFITSKSQSLPIAVNDSVMLGAVVSNTGRYLQKSTVNLLLKTKASGKITEKKFTTDNIAYSDTLYVSLKKDTNLESVEVKIDPDNLIDETSETNNDKFLNIDWTKANTQAVYPVDALPDRLNPTLGVYFDEKKITYGDYVAANATIKMVLTDENSLSINDSTLIRAYIQPCEGCVSKLVGSKNISTIQRSFNQIEASYVLPNLAKGTYKLIVDGRDMQHNTLGNVYEMEFRIADEKSPTLLVVYPNPAEDFCNFQFKIIDSARPKSGTIKVFDTQTRLLQEVSFVPTIGQNDVFLKLRNTSSGTYLYRATIEWQNETTETYEGKLIVK